MVSRRAAVTLSSLMTLATVSGSARADVSVEACSDAYTKGQEERLAGRLFSARAQFHICDDSTCPNAIVQDCKRWTTEVEADLPTITVKATTAAGDAIESLDFWVDGERVPRAELEQPLIVDAGAHVFRFEAPGFEPVQLEHSMAPEDRAFPISTVMHPLLKPATPSAALQQRVLEAPAPRPAPPAKAFPVAAVTLTTVGAIGLGSALYFGLSAKHQYDDLKDTCAPNCSASQRKSVDNKALISDLSLAASAAALATAAYLYLSATPAPKALTALALQPEPNGAQLRLALTF